MELSKYVHNNKELPGTVVTLYIPTQKSGGNQVHTYCGSSRKLTHRIAPPHLPGSNTWAGR